MKRTDSDSFPRVTVVMPVYNPHRKMLQDAVESVLAQTRPATRIFVIDDGSTDDMSWLSKHFTDPVTVLHQKNGGPAKARNTGVRAAKTPYVAFLDADDLWEPDLLRTEAALLDADPGLALAYSTVTKIDTQGHKIGASRFRPLSGHVFDQLFWRNVIATSSVVARRSCLDAVGLFNEDRSLFAVEDYDLWLRVAHRFAVAGVDRPLVRYRVHDTGISRNLSRSYHGERRVIELAAQRHADSDPELRAWLPRRIHQIHFDFGEELFWKGRFPDARTQLGQGLRHHPQDLRSWGYWLACGFPRTVTICRRMKSLWQSSVSFIS